LLGLHNGGSSDYTRISLSGLSVFCTQLAVSYSNDYFDYFVDRFTTPTSIAGGSGVLRSYPKLRPLAITIAMLLTSISLTLMIVVILTYDVSLLFGSLVVAGNLLGWSYSSPPIRLVDRKFGELTVAVITGIMLPTVGYISTKTSFSIVFSLFLIPALVYAAVFIILVEIPDMQADRKGKKQTLIARYGQRLGFYLTFLCLAGNLGYFLWLTIAGLSPFSLDATVLTGLSAVPLIALILSYLLAEKDQQSFTQLAIRGIIFLVLYLVLLDIYLLYSL
jgi:1,4-dihydroxy-2-naphthoate octaprenyltransferase